MSWIVRLTAASAAMAVIAGAFGAHGASGKAAEWLRTGAEYQMIHAIGVMAVERTARSPVPWLLLGGSALFAATLYLMAMGAPHWLGAVTPLGGAGMIAGWIMLAAGSAARR